MWQAFLRRFDLEHTFRLFKQILGWTAPKSATRDAADRWTWLIIASHTQLRLARPSPMTCAAPGNGPPRRAADPGPGPPRVSEHPRDHALPGRCTKTRQARPRTPAGSKNRRPAPRYDVGKTTKRKSTLKARRERAG